MTAHAAVSHSAALDAYLSFLDTSDSVQDKDPLRTPHINKVLASYKQKTSSSSDTGKIQEPVNYEARLAQLEEKLTGLLSKTKASPCRVKTKRLKTMPCVQSSCDSDSSSSVEQPPPVRNKSKPAGSSNATRLPTRTRGTRPSVVTTTKQDQKTKRELLREQRQSGVINKERQMTLQRDIDKERERRWKAEQVADKLVEHVRSLQTKLGDTQTKHELCVVKNSHLTQQITDSKKSIEDLNSRLQQLQGVVEDSKTELDMYHRRDNEQLDMLRALKESHRNLEREKIKEKTELITRVQVAERKAVGSEKEVELLNKSMRHFKNQVQQMQELLANRERDHQKQLENCNPKQAQELVSKEVFAERARMEVTISQYKDKIVEQQKSYQSLEEEFRMALRIETGRFQELKRAYQQVAGEVESSRETAIAAVQKEQKASSMIVELTALLKEQKGRIGELSQSKQEALTQLKEQSRAIESEVTTKHKLEAKLESLKEDNGRLLAKVQAQDSVIDGLREERQLWGKELAHQGATLAQDRGRMEAQIHTLTDEVRTTREQLCRERDRVKIKEKQVDDQLQSIQNLKQAVAEKERELGSLQLDCQREQQSLQLQLEQTQAENRDLQEQVSGLVDRKELLKDELAESQDKLEQWKSKYSKLKVQWEEKVGVLSGLESNMVQLQESFSQREHTLTQERDAAIEEARAYQQRLKTCDDAFRDQLEAKQRSHDNHMAKLLADKDRESKIAQQKVVSVENEMREVLADVAKEKQEMEKKRTKLLEALNEVRLCSPD